jgi:hypothetical protein
VSAGYAILRTAQIQATPSSTAREKPAMLYTIAIVLLVLWLLGLVSSYTMSGFIHILLVIALVLILLRIISGRKPLG